MSVILTLIIVYFSTSEKMPTEITELEISQVKLFMTRDEVESLHGKGRDPNLQCFGCEMNFIYPHLKLSGRYSETLDRSMKNGQIDESKKPKVKQITTADNSVSIFDIHLGDTIEKAAQILDSKGFKLQSDSSKNYHNYYYKGDLYIRLWSDDEIYLLNKNRDYMPEKKTNIRSITIEIRVKKDEEIQY